ncbi:MAG: hypothetical protein ABI605_01220 [Rhizobacter sp.]
MSATSSETKATARPRARRKAETAQSKQRKLQLKDLKAAVLAADHGEFTSPDEVLSVLARYSGNASGCP